MPSQVFGASRFHNSEETVHPALNCEIEGARPRIAKLHDHLHLPLVAVLFGQLGNGLAQPIQPEPRMTLQKLPRTNLGSLSASTSALTLPKVVSGFLWMPS